MPTSTSSVSILDASGKPYTKRQVELRPVKPASARDESTGVYVYAGVQSRDLPVQGIEEFADPDAVRYVLREHAEGRFYRAARLVEAMLEDSRIAGCLETRINGLQGLPFEMQPPKAGPPGRKKREAIAKKLREEWDDCFPTEDRVNLLTWGYMLGVGLGQLIWEKTPQRWKARLQVWNPAYVEWVEVEKSYYVQTMHGRSRVTPGDGQWVLFTPYGYEAGWKRALLRRLAVPYCCRLFGTRDLSRSSEVNGSPAKLAKFPRRASQEEISRFIQGLGALSVDSVVGMPVESPGDPTLTVNDVAQWDAKLLESTSRGHEIFNVLLQRADTDIAIAINGQNLTTEVKSGSLAAASVHRNVQADKVRNDGSQQRTFFREQCLRPLVVFNHGAGDATPFPTWDTEPPEDQKARADTLGALGDAAKKLREGGFPIRHLELADSFGLELELEADGSVLPVPSPDILKEDLATGTMTRDERRRALGLKPLGGKRGSEALGEVAEEVPVPPAAVDNLGAEAAQETLLTLLSLRTQALEQLRAGKPEVYGREARWFIRQVAVSFWSPAIQRELDRRSGVALPPATYARARGTPSVQVLLRLVGAATSDADLRARLERLYAKDGLSTETEGFARALAAARALAEFTGTPAGMKPPTHTPEATP